jgi:hypothetical protein
MAAPPARPAPDAPGGRVLPTALWASFLAACAASLIFFAVFDPELLSDASDHALQLSRPAGYAVGFFFFWAIGGLACAILSVLRPHGRRQ